MLGRRLSHIDQILTSNKEGGTVGTKLVPEGREEVDELEGLSTSSAARQQFPKATRQQKQRKTC